MKRTLLIWTLILVLWLIPAPLAASDTLTITSSRNLDGFDIFAEGNPGGGTDLPYDQSDAALVVHRRYGEVVSNVNKKNVWVNTLALTKSTDDFNGVPITLGKYTLKFATKLPVRPRIGNNRVPEQADFGMCIYDGRNQFGRGMKRRIEAAGFWKLNPWVNEPYVWLATDNGELYNTGVRLPYDTRWHKFVLVADYEKEEYVSLTVDRKEVKLDGLSLSVLYAPYWGYDVSAWASLEAQSAWPGYYGQNGVFWWSQYYKSFTWKFENAGT